MNGTGRQVTLTCMGKRYYSLGSPAVSPQQVGLVGLQCSQQSLKQGAFELEIFNGGEEVGKLL